MPRGDQRDTEIRRALETVATELAIMDDARAFASLRVRQAETRTGLTQLLGPALVELSRIEQGICTARTQVSAALLTLTERADVY